MRVLILGLGTNGGGASAALFFARSGQHQVRVSDTAPRSAFASMPQTLENLGVECHLGESDPREDIKWADIVIKNPAVPTSLPQLALAKKIANDFSFLFSMPEFGQMKSIAVTGTKGKSTTVAAIQHALQEMGHEAFICGNIGISAFTIIEEINRRKAEGLRMPEYIVMELSSWQIHDTYIALNGRMPHLDLAIFTSMYADHQNSYRNVKEYFDDKLHLFGPQCDRMLVSAANKRYMIERFPEQKKAISVFPGYGNPFHEKKLELQCAYSALRALGFTKKQSQKSLSTYHGMPHRIEQVAIYNDLMFVNDSAATIAEAVSFSMKNIAPLSTHLICGGTNKNLKADGMASALKAASSITLLDGSFTQSELVPLLESLGLEYSGPYNNMKDAFSMALSKAIAKRDEFRQVQCVLLSPGAASFGIFKNEFDRGNQFKRCVKSYIDADSRQQI